MPRDTTDHSRRARNVTAAPAAVVSQQRPTAPRRRAREWPKASPAFTSNDRPFCGCASTAYRVTRAARPALSECDGPELSFAGPFVSGRRYEIVVAVVTEERSRLQFSLQKEKKTVTF